MHGRTRVSVQNETEARLDLIKSSAEKQKVVLYSQIQGDVLQHHKEKRYTNDSLQQCSKLLELNPDVYTAWNYRKAAVSHLLSQDSVDNALRGQLANDELRLVERALRVNPKSYGAWHHRKWLVSNGLASVEKEFKLINWLLQLDSRNFHGWDYRRFLAQHFQVGLDAELAYSMEKITEEPRNYSAWHSRSKILMAMESSQKEKNAEAEGAEKGSSPLHLSPTALKSEFILVRNSLWTAPEDQSGFLYFIWLLGQLAKGEDDSWREVVLEEEIGLCRELLSEETESVKWPKLTLAQLLTAHQQFNGPNHKSEILSLYAELICEDPMHREYYKYQIGQIERSDHD